VDKDFVAKSVSTPNEEPVLFQERVHATKPFRSNTSQAMPNKPGDLMYIAMNRFKIALGSETTFEELWRQRESYLDEVPGFRQFHLLRGSTHDDHTLYASHSVWDSAAAFEAWTDSESFRKAHAQARAPKGTYLGHPEFEGFEAIL
jgi:heme-degrading monooxygenase HmoA